MKFQLPSLKVIGQLLITLLIAIAVGTGLLTLAYAIPVDKIDDNVADSAYIFAYEGNYPSVDDSYASYLDNFTDAMILKEAAYKGEESAFKKAMLAPRNLVSGYEGRTPAEEIVRYYEHPEDEHTVGTYARYWHGYLIFLKPILLLFNYGQIRNLNLYIQMALGILILILLIIKRDWQLIPAYVLTAVMLRIGLSAYSMQHSNIYYIVLIASVLLLIFNEKLKEKNGMLIFFLLIGAATSYFDYLTYPMVAFGIPAALFVFMNRYDKHSDIRIVLNLLICWLAGYVGMWAGKWILATISTDQNVITDAIQNIKVRSGSVLINQEQVTYGDTLLQTISAYLLTPYIPAYLVVLVIEVILFVFLHKKHPLKESFSFILICLLPLVWYSFTVNHSYSHKYLFTYKEWAMTTFALLALFANIEFKSGSRQISNKGNKTAKKGK